MSASCLVEASCYGQKLPLLWALHFNLTTLAYTSFLAQNMFMHTFATYFLTICDLLDHVLHHCFVSAYTCMNALHNYYEIL